MTEANAIVSIQGSLVREIESALPLDPYTPISFDEVDRLSRIFADRIEREFERVAEVLLHYESYEVVVDETSRTLDILRNLHENKKFFQLRVSEIASFLPRNQPLYAFTCFVIIPSFMAHKVHFRIPHSMRRFFPELLALLDVERTFPNIVVSRKERLDFLTERSALRIHPLTGESIPVTDAVIFTGTSAHADQLRVVFDSRTLFIANGAGHNPVVVCKDADLRKAVEAVLTLQLYNQGQDCSAPNAVLVHKEVYIDFLNLLHTGLKSVGIGEYSDRSCRIGPNSDPKDLVRIQDFLIHHREWISPVTPGTIHACSAVIEPTIIHKPLKEGGNFTEIFAPVIFVQQYEKDSDLSLYFESPHYAPNAMYATVYGTSAYVESLVGLSFGGRVLHDKASILNNVHLHSVGSERGTEPHGGYGRGASSISIHGKITCKPTLPQRDIYEWVAKPLLRKNLAEKMREKLSEFKLVKEKNVSKLLRLMNQETQGPSVSHTDTTYIDLRSTRKPKGRRYIKLEDKHTYYLLDKPNVERAARLEPGDIVLLRKLRTLLKRRGGKTLEMFQSALYALPNKAKRSTRQNHAAQLRFFQIVYQLLFGKDHGPRLARFLRETETDDMLILLDV